MTVDPAAARGRLSSGYYNSDDYDGAANPGGLANDGHETNFPAALVDVGAAAEQAGVDAGTATAKAAEAAASAGAAAGSAGAAAASVVAAAGEANRAVAEANRSRDEANRAEVAAATVSGSTVPDPAPGNTGHVPRSDGSTWGTIPVGTGVGQIVPLVDVGGGVAGLPAVDGSLLSGIGRLPRTHVNNWAGIGAGHKGHYVTLNPAGLIQLTFQEPEDLGGGWYCWIINEGPADVKCVFPSSKFVDEYNIWWYGEFLMYPNEVRLFQCDGGSIRSVVVRPFRLKFSVSGAFARPPGYRRFAGLAWGGGGGGGAGAAQASGGGGGACVPFDLDADALDGYAAPTAVVIGAGGLGANHPSHGSATVGAAGGTTMFHSVHAPGGGGGTGSGVTQQLLGGGGGGLPSALLANGNKPPCVAGGYAGGAGASPDSQYNLIAWGSVWGGGQGGNAQQDYPYSQVSDACRGGWSEYGGGGGGAAWLFTSGGTTTGYTSTSLGSRIGGHGGSGRAGPPYSAGQDGFSPGGGGGGWCGNAAGYGGRGGDGHLTLWGVV